MITKRNLKTKLYIIVNPFVIKGIKLSVSHGDKGHYRISLSKLRLEYRKMKQNPPKILFKGSLILLLNCKKLLLLFSR